jgi:hypothetical protein
VKPLFDPTQPGSVEYEPELIRLGEVAARASQQDLYGVRFTDESWFVAWWADRDTKHHWIRVARAVRDAIATPGCSGTPGDEVEPDGRGRGEN